MSQGGDLSWALRRASRLDGGSVAVIRGERSVTYRELAGRANALVAGHERRVS